MIRAKKSLGQNFLIDKNILNRIVDVTKIKDQIILEVGPGSGNLTSYILDRKPKKIFVVEEHCLNGGGTGSVQDVILKNSLSVKSYFLNLENLFVKNYGEHEDLKKELGFSKKNYLKIIKNLLKK